jgi:hypothetical protein
MKKALTICVSRSTVMDGAPMELKELRQHRIVDFQLGPITIFKRRSW